MKDRVKKEQAALPEMIQIYCHGVHKTRKGQLCPECQALCDYALNRLAHCPFGDNKTFCSQCPIHCYKPDMRERIRAVMRYAGPRIMFVHPVAGTAHVISTIRGVIAKKKKEKKGEL